MSKTYDQLAPAVVARKAIEKRVITEAIDQLLAAGFSLGVNDGEETTLKHSVNKKHVLRALFTTDEDYLLVYLSITGRQIGWVRLVYGNDGWDVINDYTTNLEPQLASAEALANRIADGNFSVTIR
jgi:hypothetical protein